MGKIIIGSARIDERGKLSGGKIGDQKQKTTPDYAGEVSLQNFYHHKKGWYIFRAKLHAHAVGIAQAMYTACNNANIGYDQGNRTNILKTGVRSTVKTECDCSSLVRACIIDATGKDPGNFTTSTESTILTASGLFEARKTYKNGMELYTGDILVTKTKGHTVVVVSGLARGGQDPAQDNSKYYPKYTGKSASIVDALVSLRINATKENRKKIAAANGIPSYTGTAQENTYLLNLLKGGKLKRV